MAKRRKKSKSKKYIRINRRLFYVLLAILLIGDLVAIVQNWDTISDTFNIKGVSGGTNLEKIAKRTQKNYGTEIDLVAKQFNLPANYLKAVVALECSGNKPAKSRFERGVYNRLLQLKSGKLRKFENLTPVTLKSTPESTIKLLANSWGPFQLMGYKCYFLGTTIDAIKGSKAVYWGAKWINETYGSYLREEKYADAFHIHNTGRSHPRFGQTQTYDPNYVSKGMKLMEYF